MYPTPRQQIAAALRLIELARQGPPEEMPELLEAASRLLRRLERTLDLRMPFLLDDSERAQRLLTELRSDLPSMRADIDAAASRSPPTSEEEAREQNLHWQRLLAHAVSELPDDEVGAAARARIAHHARQRIAADPTLNRDPWPRSDTP